MPGAEIAEGTQFIQVAAHGVTGYTAWKGMADGMTSAPADQAPPHLGFMKELWLGPQVMPYSISVCHVIDGKENLEAVSDLFTPGSEFMNGFSSNPIVKVDTMEWNNMDVRLIHNESAVVEEGMVLGVYAHGVPDIEEWLKTFNSPDVEGMHASLNIVKSYGGKCIHCKGIKSTFLPDETKPIAMVIHVFKNVSDKTKFDMMFDPSADFFKGLIDAGAISEPFQCKTLGPLFKHTPAKA